MSDPLLNPARVERLVASYGELPAEEWAIYADELSARGDPRGELIQLELHVLATAAEEAYDEALVERHAALLEQHRGRWYPDWFNDDERELPFTLFPLHGYFHSAMVFVSPGADMDELGRELERALSCEAALMLADLTLYCMASQFAPLVDALAHGPANLRSLSVQVTSPAGSGAEPLIDGPRCAAMVARLTKLRRLELTGCRVFEALELPQLRRLELTGYDALTGWGAGSTCMPALRELRFALLDSWDERTTRLSRAELRELLDAARLPALRVLHLDENAGGRRAVDGCRGGAMAEALFDAILDAPILAQLEHLSLPPPPTPAHVERMLASTQLAAIERVELRRTPFPLDPEAVARSPVQLELGLVYPMRLRGQIDAEERVRLRIEGASERVEFERDDFAQLIERAYAQLDPEPRAFLATLCQELDALELFDDTAEPEPEPEPEPELELEPAPAPRRGLFRRLFGRRGPEPAPPVSESAPPTPPARPPAPGCVRDHAMLAEVLLACRELCGPYARGLALEGMFDALERARPPGTRVTLRRV